MKKYLITAAVFLTGTALANAATVTDATLPTGFVWTAADITLSRSSNSSGSGTTLTAGRAGLASISVGGQSYTSFDLSEWNWQISFDVTAATFSGTTTTQMLFSTEGGSNGNGYAVALSLTNGIYSYDIRSGSQSVNGSDNQPGKPILEGSSIEIGTSVASTVTLLWDAANESLYFSAGSTTKKIAGDDVISNLKLTTIANGKDDASEIGHGSVGTESRGPVFWTNGGMAKFDNIALKVSPVPEPSTFGLLAGLGALALAGTRRRRRAK